MFWSHTNNINAASYRVRCREVVNQLRSNGIDVDFYRKKHVPKVMILSQRYDVKSIKRSLKLQKKFNTIVGLDLCDNHFYNEYQSIVYKQRYLDLIQAIHSVDFIISSTESLKQEIITHLHQNKDIHVMDDMIKNIQNQSNYFSYSYWNSFLQYQLLKRKIQNIKQERRFIWFGNRGSLNAPVGMRDLKIVVKNLEKLNLKESISLTVLSNDKPLFNSLFRECKFNTFYTTWNKWFFSKFLLLHSIALIPININPFTICKTNNRVISSIYHNLAVCATCIPSYKQIIDCIDDIDDWDTYLNKYITPNACSLQISRAKNIINENFSVDVIGAKWKKLIMEKLNEHCDMFK